MKHPNYTPLYHKWKYKKLREKADCKRRRELVAYHEAGHFVVGEIYGLSPRAKIYTNMLGRWAGWCKRDEVSDTDQIANIAIAGFMGEFCYLLRCQRQLRNGLDPLIIFEQVEEMIDFFNTTSDYLSVDDRGDADKIRLLHSQGRLKQTTDFSLRTMSANLSRLYEVAENLFYEQEYNL